MGVKNSKTDDDPIKKKKKKAKVRDNIAVSNLIK